MRRLPPGQGEHRRGQAQQGRAANQRGQKGRPVGLAASSGRPQAVGGIGDGGRNVPAGVAGKRWAGHLPLGPTVSPHRPVKTLPAASLPAAKTCSGVTERRRALLQFEAGGRGRVRPGGA